MAATQYRRATPGRSAAREPYPLSNKLKILLSYYYAKNFDLDKIYDALAPYDLEIMADSGAYSAYTTGNEINVRDYIAWLHRWQHRLDTYICLDDLRSPERTWDNQKAMESDGLAPLPVFHYGEPWQWLEHAAADHSYILLGSMVSIRERTTQQRLRWFSECFRRVGDRAVFHALGIGRPAILNKLPFYSADSSTYLNGPRYGMMPLYDDRRDQWVQIRSNGGNIKPCHLDLLRSYGISAALLQRTLWELEGRGRGPRFDNVSASCSVAAFIRYEAALRARFGRVSIPGHPDAKRGMRYYVAYNDYLFLCPEHMGWKLLLDDVRARRQA